MSSLCTDKLSDLARGAATGGGGDGEVKRKRRVEVLVKRSRDPAGSKDKVREPGGAKIVWKKKDETDGKSKNQLEIVFL